MFGFSRSQSAPRTPRGRRAYAIGDVHGRHDLLETLLGDIHCDIESRGAAKVLLVFLGDLIDRGPGSAEVVERLRTYQHEGVRPVFLLGNHEEVLLRILSGETELIKGWLKFGGTQCLKSYGADAREIKKLPEAEALTRIRNAIPSNHVEFLKAFNDTCRFGDYLFVHAGIRPGVELERQRQSDLRWIRQPFLLDETDHGFIVVHGHTISTGVDERSNRVGIDTGAYSTGILTAVGIENGDRWFIDTKPAGDNGVSPSH